MPTICKPLVEVTAAEIMTRDPVVIPRHLSLRAAAHLLSQSRVTGAPVVNGRGECVGVLSATDFLQWAEDHKPAEARSEVWESLWDSWPVEPGNLPEEDISAYMTADPVTAPPTITITELARHMIDAHIHRIVIVDEKRRPIGIVSSTDILAAVAQAAPV